MSSALLYSYYRPWQADLSTVFYILALSSRSNGLSASFYDPDKPFLYVASVCTVEIGRYLKYRAEKSRKVTFELTFEENYAILHYAISSQQKIVSPLLCRSSVVCSRICAPAHRRVNGPGDAPLCVKLPFLLFREFLITHMNKKIHDIFSKHLANQT